MSELTDNGALALAGLIRRREVSVREVVKAHLERIDAVNGRIHAVVRCSETALEEADRADRALADGTEPGVLHGVPFTVKDWIETQGLVCDGGFPERNGHVPTADATVVARLRRAGAVLLGKTRAGSDPRLHPPALNPHDPTRTAGSSSGGEAALLAGFGSPLGLGSDSGGSLRWPAHCCGVAALKPSAGLVPLTGHYPPIVTLTDPRTVIGPMARCVADLAVALSLIAGPDGVDPSTVPARIDDGVTCDLATLRVAWFTDFDGVAACPATRSVIERVIGVLGDRGASVRQAAPPRIDEAMAVTRAYWARPESLSLDDWQPWGRSTLSADEVEESLFRWERLRRALLGFMADVDVIVCPVAAEVAPARHEPRAGDYAFTVPFSLTGNPVVVIPAGRGEGDLPIGIQIVGAPYRDRLALSVAGTLERSLSR